MKTALARLLKLMAGNAEATTPQELTDLARFRSRMFPSEGDFFTPEHATALCRQAEAIVDLDTSASAVGFWDSLDPLQDRPVLTLIPANVPTLRSPELVSALAPESPEVPPLWRAESPASACNWEIGRVPEGTLTVFVREVSPGRLEVAVEGIAGLSPDDNLEVVWLAADGEAISPARSEGYSPAVLSHPSGRSLSPGDRLRLRHVHLGEDGETLSVFRVEIAFPDE
jgi:hypothetical protein